MVRKKQILDYSHIDNQKKLLKEFANKYPNEILNFFEHWDNLQRNSKISIDFTINNPPPYQIDISNKIKKRFYSLKFPLTIRRMLIAYMEYDLLGKNPRLKISIKSSI